MATLQQPIHSGFGETTTAMEVMKGSDPSGKVIIVAGGHSGIGLEITKVLSKAGAKVIVGARDITTAETVLVAPGNVIILT